MTGEAGWYTGKLARRIVVAIDGPAGAGKSTIARRVAGKLGILYIDSGAMYRAVAYWARKIGVALDDMHRLEQLASAAKIVFLDGSAKVLLNGEDVTEAIRTPEIGEAASKVATVPGVRRALVEKQRAMGEAASVVMEGRDIGTVVFPSADVKIFLDASAEARAGRRLRELNERGETVNANQVEGEISQRDLRDRSRAESPLVQAPDAVYLDSSGRSIEEVEELVLKLVRERTSNGKGFGGKEFEH
jgi:cytidylate kinase